MGEARDIGLKRRCSDWYEAMLTIKMVGDDKAGKALMCEQQEWTVTTG